MEKSKRYASGKQAIAKWKIASRMNECDNKKIFFSIA